MHVYLKYCIHCYLLLWFEFQGLYLKELALDRVERNSKLYCTFDYYHITNGSSWRSKYRCYIWLAWSQKSGCYFNAYCWNIIDFSCLCSKLYTLCNWSCNDNTSCCYFIMSIYSRFNKRRIIRGCLSNEGVSNWYCWSNSKLLSGSQQSIPLRL